MLYYILSLITFIGSMTWTPMKKDNTMQISQFFINSGVVQDYGENSLIRKFVRLNPDIFYGGQKVLIPKGATIIRAPENLELAKQPVNMTLYDWYTAIYKKGYLKDRWNNMKSRFCSQLGIRDLTNINEKDIQRIAKKIPAVATDMEKNNKKIQISSIPPDDNRKIVRFADTAPHRVYTSFIVIKTQNGEYKVLPVVLRLEPLQRIETNVLKTEKEVKGK